MPSIFKPLIFLLSLSLFLSPTSGMEESFWNTPFDPASGGAPLEFKAWNRAPQNFFTPVVASTTSGAYPIDQGHVDFEDLGVMPMDLSSDTTESVYGLSYTHLTTFEEHESYLLQAITGAQSKILLTSWNFTARPENHRELFDALMDAAVNRGVKIYLYFSKGNDVRLSGQAALNIKQSKVNCHSKILAVDSDILALGSYDWMQDPSSQYATLSLNESIVLEGSVWKPFFDQIWTSITSYRALSFNPEKVNGFEKRFTKLPLQIKQLNGNSRIELITTPQRHRDSFLNTLTEAAQRFVFCAFSISAYPNMLEDFLPLQLVGPFLESGRILQIFYNPAVAKIDLLKLHLKSYSNHDNLVLTPKEGLHLKAWFADNGRYAIGSYNALSSADTLRDDYTNMETTVDLSGDLAQGFISYFELNFPETRKLSHSVGWAFN